MKYNIGVAISARKLINLLNYVTLAYITVYHTVLYVLL